MSDINIFLNGPFTSASSRSRGSDAYVHRVKSAVVQGENKLIAELPLPFGRWVVSAKAVLLWIPPAGDEGSKSVRCKLVADDAEDFASNTMIAGPPVSNPSDEQVIALLLGVDLKVDGVAQLFGSVNTGSLNSAVSFSHIVISAIRVNTLEIDTGRDR